MELNQDGTISARSVQEIKRINIKPKENQSIKYRLATVRRGRVRLGEIAVIGDREWLRVNPDDFHGAAWIEIQKDVST